MSLRYRLFLTVSVLFILVAACTAFLENYAGKRELAKAQCVLREKIVAMSEAKRKDIQTYLTATLADEMTRIDAVLNNISSFTPQILRFAPTQNNMQEGTWGNSSDLLLEFKWIDFLQNTNQGQTTSLIVPQPHVVGTAFRVEIDDDLAWVYLGELQSPYLGIRIPYATSKPLPSSNDQEVVETVSGAIPEALVLFDPQAMKTQSSNAPIFQSQPQSWPPIPVHWSEGDVLEVDPFVKAFQRAREMLLSGKIQPPAYASQEVQQKMGGFSAVEGGLLDLVPETPLLSTVLDEKLMRQKFEETSLRYIQINMIWGMIALYDTGMFGNQMFSYPSPAASALFSPGGQVGFGVEVKNVLFPQPIFDDAGYYSQNSTPDQKSRLASSIAVIPSPLGTHDVFLGNALKLNVKTPSGEKTGYLTVAGDGDAILQELVIATHQSAILYTDRPLSAYDMNGEKILDVNASDLPFSDMVKNLSGIVTWKGENYYYLNLKPFPNSDLRVFLLNPEAVEFALLHDLESGTEKVIHSILLNIHIAALIGLLIIILALNSISKRITKPIIQLAKATDDVVAGRLDEIELHLPPLKHEDEIAVLCHSFEEMVKGLIEKEKVKGVLNKVVSREIAEEILKGTVHLGGEEMKVTVLFADIRGFTQLTQNMPPKDVIEMLNTCMTKLSQAVDRNGGVIDKFVGDEVMALFGAPIACEDAALKSIRAALEMVEAMKEWNRERASTGLPPIEIGIGIHTGTMLAGNMGAENRLNYTVIGSNVNLAARLCSSAQRMEILISNETLNEPHVKENIAYDEVPSSTFKGFDKPVQVYRVRK